jgi:predicted nucleotidyltransferase
MEKDRILVILREHQPELEAAGLAHLRLFGSVARGDHRADSDVDLLFDYDESSGLNALRAFGYEERVAQIIGAPVHLTSAKHLRSEFRDRVLAESLSAY